MSSSNDLDWKTSGLPEAKSSRSLNLSDDSRTRFGRRAPRKPPSKPVVKPVFNAQT